jgi:predicted enzyme related to lactoylglutathione lyase
MANDERPTLGDGKICYIEIPAVDVTVSAAFYAEVFGWDVRNRGDGSVAFDDAVGEVSGTWVTGRKPHSHPDLMIHIMVYDIEKTMAAITANGGAIVQPVGMDLPEITARFSDPAGNIFGLYQHRR